MAQAKAPVVKLLTEDDLLVLTQAFHDRLDVIAKQQQEILTRLAEPARLRRGVLKPTRP
jgi:hypothetical protein